MGTPNQRLRNARVDAGLSQQELANRAGISLRTVQSGEAGISPRRATMAVWAFALGKHRDELWPPQQQARRAA